MKKKNIKKKKRKFSIYKMTGLLLFCVSIIFCVVMTMLDILPSKYYLLVVIILLIMNISVDSFLFRKKVKKHKKNTALGITFVLLVLLITPIIYMSKTLGFMMKISTTNYKIENYSVIVLKESNYNSIEDINGQSVGIYENTEGIKQAKKKLLDKIDVTFKSYDNGNTICQDLLEKKIDVIVVEDTILNMVKEENGDFESSIKVIHSFKIKIKSNNEAKSVNVVEEPFNVYITGIDTYGDISSVSRSDVNIVMTVNPKTKQILLTSIPRDYYVELHGKKGSKDKLTHAGIYGTDMSISTIEDLLGIEINYYIKVNFSSFIDIINTLGGIEVYSKYAFTSIDGIKYQEGDNNLNGEQALSFARERKAFSEGDRQRGANQQAVIEAVIKKMCSKSISTKYDSLLNSIEGKFQTNMSKNTITSLIKMQLDDMASWNVVSINLDGSNGKGITYSGGNQELYVMIPDWDTVDEASSTIKAVLDGTILDDSYKADKSKSTRKIKSYSTGDVQKASKNEESPKTESIEEDNKKRENEIVTIVEEKKEEDDDKVVEITIEKDDDNKNKTSKKDDDNKQTDSTTKTEDNSNDNSSNDSEDKEDSKDAQSDNTSSDESDGNNSSN